MIVPHPEQYELVEFKVNHGPRYKYDAVLRNKRTGVLKKVPFGGRRTDGTPYEQYHDKLGAYTAYDHGDARRRRLYRTRHAGEQHRKFSSGYFAWKYLW